MIAALLRRLRRPELAGLDDDDPALGAIHARIIRTDPLLRRLYLTHYRMLNAALAGIPSGPVLEIGSGGGFFRDIRPDAVTSDVVPLPGVDRVIPAGTLPFPPSTLAGIVMLNVFHHLPDPAAFLRAAQIALIPGGRVAMIEPAHTLLWSRLYRGCSPEPYDPGAGWGFPPAGRLTGANVPQAWIVFVRDRDRYAREFPGLPVRSVRPHTSIGLLAAGGLRYRGLVPGGAAGAVDALERVVTPVRRWTASQLTIVLGKPLI